MRGRISDFTSVASRYDATRHVPESLLTQCYELLLQRGILPSAGTILDAGCGTGQISIPLAARGLDIVGIDVSDAMVRIASSKISPGQRARYEVNDVRAINYSNDSFDAVVFSKLLMHIEDWRQCCCELVRVSKPGSHIIHIIDRGVFGDSVRREFTRLTDQAGYTSRFLGAMARSGEIAEAMSALGCETITVKDNRLAWDHCTTRQQSLDYFEERLFAEFWYLPAELYGRVLAEASEWAKAQPGGLDEPEHLAGFLLVEAYKTPR